MSLQPAALLLDLDGTLVDTPRAIAQVLGDTLRSAGHPVEETAVRATIGRPLDHSVALLTGCDATGPEVLGLVTAYRHRFTAEVIPRAAELVLPGVEQLLRQAQAHDIPTAVVTSKTSDSAHALLEAAGLEPFFDYVVCHDMVERGKPHPDMALAAASLVGADPRRAWVVGDGVDDMRMARAASMRALAVATGVGSVQELRQAGAHHTVTDLRDAAHLLGTGLPEAPTAAVGR